MSPEPRPRSDEGPRPSSRSWKPNRSRPKRSAPTATARAVARRAARHRAGVACRWSCDHSPSAAECWPRDANPPLEHPWLGRRRRGRQRRSGHRGHSQTRRRTWSHLSKSTSHGAIRSSSARLPRHSTTTGRSCQRLSIGRPAGSAMRSWPTAHSTPCSSGSYSRRCSTTEQSPANPERSSSPRSTPPSERITVGSTHFPRSDGARRKHAGGRLLDVCQNLTDPFVICGDFNQPASSWVPASISGCPLGASRHLPDGETR